MSDQKPYRKMTPREPQGVPYNYKDITKSGILNEEQVEQIVGGTNIINLITESVTVDDATSTVKGILKLTHDLGGTSDLPRVTGITETSGPTELVIGSIADGYVAKRVGATLVGVDPATFSGSAVNDQNNILANQVFGG